MWESISSRNEEEEGENQDPPSHPEGGSPDLSLLVCARATRRVADILGVDRLSIRYPANFGFDGTGELSALCAKSPVDNETFHQTVSLV